MRNLLIALILLFVAWLFFPKPAQNLSYIKPENVIETSEKGFILGNEIEKWQFSFDEELNLSTVFFDKVKGVKLNKTSLKGFVALTPEDYEEFLDITNCKTCPSPFLNRHVSFFIYLSDNEQVIKALNSSKRGDHITLSGYYVTPSIVFKGKTVDMSLGSNQDFVYINDIDLK